MTRGRPFAKGQSGNPGGRPAVVAEIRELAQQYTMTALRTLVEIAERGENESARVAAANALLDRAWGKAAVPIVAAELPPTITLNFGTELRPPNHANEDAARTIEAAPSRLLPVTEEEE